MQSVAPHESANRPEMADGAAAVAKAIQSTRASSPHYTKYVSIPAAHARTKIAHAHTQTCSLARTLARTHICARADARGAHSDCSTSCWRSYSAVSTPVPSSMTISHACPTGETVMPGERPLELCRRCGLQREAYRRTGGDSSTKCGPRAATSFCAAPWLCCQ